MRNQNFLLLTRDITEDTKLCLTFMTLTICFSRVRYCYCFNGMMFHTNITECLLILILYILIANSQDPVSSVLDTITNDRTVVNTGLDGSSFQQTFLQSMNEFFKTSKGTFSWLNTLTQTQYEMYNVDEGDVAINKKDYESKVDRAIKTWIRGVVYYIFDPSVSRQMKDLINLAMKEWEDHSCVQFRHRSSVRQIFYVRFRSDRPGCFSFIGKQFKDVLRGQDINFGPGCENLHTLVHELGHALGLSHEQARSDRDHYININTQNINGQMAGQFSKGKTLNEILPYDYKSVMQYPSWGFSIKPYQKITMTTRNPMYQYLLDEERQGLSLKDIKVVNIIYDCHLKCIEGSRKRKEWQEQEGDKNVLTMNQSFQEPPDSIKWETTFSPSTKMFLVSENPSIHRKGVSSNSRSSAANLTSDSCKNGGFLVPYKTKDKSKCICLCPNGFRGNHCEESILKDTDEDYGLRYYGGLRCGGNITQNDTVITTPGYPIRNVELPGCSWWIKSPSGMKVQVFFHDFSFKPPVMNTEGTSLVCVDEKIEVRNKDLFDPVM